MWGHAYILQKKKKNECNNFDYANCEAKSVNTLKYWLFPQPSLITSILLDVKERKFASVPCELSFLIIVKFFLVLADSGRGGVTHPPLATPKWYTTLSTKIQFSPRREWQIRVISVCLCVCRWFQAICGLWVFDRGWCVQTLLLWSLEKSHCLTSTWTTYRINGHIDAPVILDITHNCASVGVWEGLAARLILHTYYVSFWHKVGSDPRPQQS